MTNQIIKTSENKALLVLIQNEHLLREVVKVMAKRIKRIKDLERQDDNEYWSRRSWEQCKVARAKSMHR